MSYGINPYDGLFISVLFICLISGYVVYRLLFIPFFFKLSLIGKVVLLVISIAIWLFIAGNLVEIIISKRHMIGWWVNIFISTNYNPWGGTSTVKEKRFGLEIIIGSLIKGILLFDIQWHSQDVIPVIVALLVGSGFRSLAGGHRRWFGGFCGGHLHAGHCLRPVANDTAGPGGQQCGARWELTTRRAKTLWHPGGYWNCCVRSKRSYLIQKG